jgi:transcriptional regulator with XRE-family HTH domain
MEKETGIPAGTFGSWISRGESFPAVDNAFKIAEALGVSIKFLLTGKEYAEHRLEGDVLQNVVSYLQNLDRDNLLRVEGVLMALNLSSNAYVQHQKRERSAG